MDRTTPWKVATGAAVAVIVTSIVGGAAAEQGASQRQRARAGAARLVASFEAHTACMQERVDGFPSAPDHHDPGWKQEFERFLKGRGDRDGNLTIGEYPDVDAAFEACKKYLPDPRETLRRVPGAPSRGLDVCGDVEHALHDDRR